MTVNLLDCTEEHSGQGRWTISRSLRHGSATKVPYLFGTNTLSIVFVHADFSKMQAGPATFYFLQKSINLGSEDLQ